MIMIRINVSIVRFIKKGGNMVRRICLVVMVMMFLFAGVLPAEDNLQGFVDELKGFHWSGSVGSEVIYPMDERRLRQVGYVKLAESKHKWISIGGIWPDPYGIAPNLNLKKALMTAYYWMSGRIEDEGVRDKIDSKVGAWKHIRIDVGGFIGMNGDGEEKHGPGFLTVEFAFGGVE